MNNQHLSPLNYLSIGPTGSKRPQFVSPQPFDQHHPAPVRRSHLWITLIAWGSGLLLFIGALMTIQVLSKLSLAPLPTTVSDRSTISPTATMNMSTLASVGSVLIDASTLVGTTKSEVETPVAIVPDVSVLQQLMLTLINNDRRVYGLSELAWDSTAATTGLRHAEEMARFGYLSHWSLDGYGPDYRYALAGGLNTVWENAYARQHRFGAGPTSPEQWQEFIRHAHQVLMESQKHHDNILAAEHTHVGIGIAYEPATGWLTITQEFVNRYLVLQSPPDQVSLNDAITVAGRLENGASNPVLNLAYEPLPTPLTVTELKATGTYSSAAQNYEAMALMVDSHGRFEQSITLNHEGRAGLYHIRIWVDTTFGKVLAADMVVKVQ